MASPTRFAANTRVPMDRSRQEAERVLMRYGATGFAYSWERRREVGPHLPIEGIDRDIVLVAFKMPTPSGQDRQVRLEVPMPHAIEHRGSLARAEQAQRQRWRALVLVLKAKLEAVAAGISSLDSEFLAGVVMQDGRTVGEALLPRLSEAVRTGRLLGPASNPPTQG